jgi:hypothetical protein
MGTTENIAGGPYELAQNAQLLDLFRAFGRKLKLQIRTHVPASIVSYVPATNKATLLVQIQQVVKVVDITKLPVRAAGPPRGIPPNADVVIQPLQLVNIPVQWPRTNLGYITFPLNAGDTGLLHVNDRSVEQWLTAGIPTEPILAFTHSLKDSVFYPGYHSDVTPITPPVDTTATVIEGTPQVKIGRTATESITKAESLLTALIAAVTASATGTMDGGALFKTNLIAQLGMITPAQIGSVKGKVE